MKTARKVLILALCAVLLVSISVMGTMAYLTSQASVTNTFTVGKVGIELDEALVDANGKEITDENAKRVKENKYKLLPGLDYDKDPSIRVASDSENCWLFVKVENGIAAIESGSIATQMTTNGWTPIAEGSNIYARAAANKAGDSVKVFEHFTIKDDVNNTTLATYNGKTIVVTAYAIQAAGFEGKTASEIWTAANFAA